MMLAGFRPGEACPSPSRNSPSPDCPCFGRKLTIYLGLFRNGSCYWHSYCNILRQSPVVTRQRRYLAKQLFVSQPRRTRRGLYLQI